MSKKIKIPSVNIKSNLSDLFHMFINRKYKSERRRIELYDDMDDEELLWLMQQQGYVFHDIMDDDYDYGNYYEDDDEIDVIWPPKSSKKGKKDKRRTADDIYDEFWNTYEKKGKRKHRKGKKARLVDINQPYSGDEEDPDEVGFSPYEEVGDDDGIMEGKEIYYYPDYHDKNSRLEFTTLKAFCEFCDDNGFTVSDDVANRIMFRRVSHTCLKPESREYGLYEIMAEESYGVLVYEVCDPCELGQL